jgi:GAF domain-containing protein
VPVSQPSRPVVRLKGDDLIADLFEAMHDLHFARDPLVAAEFVLNLALEKMPSRVALVHFFDIDAREFVVVRAKGRGAENVLGCRTPERDLVIVEAMRRTHAVIVNATPTEPRLRAERFAKLGYECRSLITGPVEQAGRFLGLLELCNPRDGGVYGEGDGHALTYMGEQLAGYLAERGVILDPERIQSR